ncbi:MAG: hypothetical protein Q9227_007896 [Pyrenula ochraceoflavens]
MSDLWITGFYSHQYEHLVAIGQVDVEATSDVQWKVDLAGDELHTPDWVFRFVQTGITPSEDQGQQISSPGVFVMSAAAASSSIAATKSKPSKTASSATASSLSKTPTSTSPSKSSSLTPGAEAGIGIGTVVGAVLLVTLTVFLVRRKYRRAASPPSYQQTEGAPFQPVRQRSDDPKFLSTENSLQRQSVVPYSDADVGSGPGRTNEERSELP